MEEKDFLKQRDVRVTNTRFIVGKDTYVLSNITSVKARTEDPKRAFLYFLIVIGSFFLISGIPDSNGGAIISGIIIILFALICLIGQKSYYIVALTTAGGEIEALKNTDQIYIEKVINALNDAIVYRG